jgi:hypothetical protein
MSLEKKRKLDDDDDDDEETPVPSWFKEWEHDHIETYVLPFDTELIGDALYFAAPLERAMCKFRLLGYDCGQYVEIKVALYQNGRKLDSFKRDLDVSVFGHSDYATKQVYEQYADMVDMIERWLEFMRRIYADENGWTDQTTRLIETLKYMPTTHTTGTEVQAVAAVTDVGK